MSWQSNPFKFLAYICFDKKCFPIGELSVRTKQPNVLVGVLGVCFLCLCQCCTSQPYAARRRRRKQQTRDHSRHPYQLDLNSSSLNLKNDLHKNLLQEKDELEQKLLRSMVIQENLRKENEQWKSQLEATQSSNKYLIEKVII